MVVHHIIPVVGVQVVSQLRYVHQAHLIIVGYMVVVMGIVVQMVQFKLVILVVVVVAVVQVVLLAHQEAVRQVHLARQEVVQVVHPARQGGVVVVVVLQVHRLVHHPAAALLRLVEQ